jgi:hypothetical protein
VIERGVQLGYACPVKVGRNTPAAVMKEMPQIFAVRGAETRWQRAASRCGTRRFFNVVLTITSRSYVQRGF